MRMLHLIVMLLISVIGGCRSPEPSDRIFFDLGRTHDVFSGVELFKEKIVETNVLPRGYRLDVIGEPFPLYVAMGQRRWFVIIPSSGGGGFDHYWVREFSSDGTLDRKGVLWANFPSLPAAVVEVDASLNPSGRKPQSRGTYTGIVYIDPEDRDLETSISGEALLFNRETQESEGLFVDAVVWEDGEKLPFGYGNFLDAQIHDVRSLDPNFTIRSENGRFYIEWIEGEDER